MMIDAASEIAANPADRTRVMVVDDSAIVRGLMTRMLKQDPEIEVVASAAHGLMAVNTLKQTRVDVILLDIEMPEMDGITALPKLLEIQPDVKIIMVSTLTLRNAEISMKAMEMGASDYLPKPSSRSSGDVTDQFYHELIGKVKALSGKKGKVAIGPEAFTPAPSSADIPTLPVSAIKPVTLPPKPLSASPSKYPVTYPTHQIKAVAVVCSTGGPQALLKLYGGLKGRLNHVPIFITQHMPPTFTTLLSDHLRMSSGKACAEGKTGEQVQAGFTYMAPGDYHMEIVQNVPYPLIQLNQNPPENFCRPSADPMLRSLSAVYGKHLLLAVLTGMGSDGLKGAQAVTAAGGFVIAQDEASCVVWGMPRAVTEANLCGAVLPLDDIAPYLIKAVEG